MQNVLKRGQLTLFLIVSIVIVFLIIGSFLFIDVNDAFSVDPEIRVVHDAITSCIDSVTEESLEDIGISGGYFNLPDLRNDLSIPYYYYEDEPLMPSLETIEQELSAYNEALLYVCFEKAYRDLPDFFVRSGEIDVTTDITSEDTVEFFVDYPFSVEKDNTSYYFSDGFSVSYDVSLHTIHVFISEVMKLHAQETRAMCVSCISDLALGYELYVDVWDAGNDVLFFVTDPESVINDKSYQFYFVIKPKEERVYDPFESV